MLKHKSEKGQALVLIVLAIVGLMGLTALTIDGGNAYSDRRHAQNAADAAVMASALAKVRGQDWQAAALSRALQNGYNNDQVTNLVQVVSPPASGPYAGDGLYIQVIITSYIDTYFAPVIGYDQVTNRVQAVARATVGGSAPLFEGAAIVTLKETGTTFTTGGNPKIIVKDSGIFVNSSSNCAMSSVGNVTLQVDTAFAIVAPNQPMCTLGNVTVNGPVTSASQVPYPPQIDIPAPSIECSGNGSLVGNTYQPGNYNGITLNANGNYTFAPGNYCFNGNVILNGNLNISAMNVNFRINSGEFRTTGNSSFTCDHMIVYGAGGSGLHFNGNGDIFCTNTTFYMESGDVRWNGNADNTFTAPSSGPAANVLIYMPYGNNSDLLINGNADSLIRGTIIAVSAPIEIKGNTTTQSIESQIIGYTVKATGNGFFNINYDPGENVIQDQPPTIELAQ